MLIGAKTRLWGSRFELASAERLCSILLILIKRFPPRFQCACLSVLRLWSYSVILENNEGIPTEQLADKQKEKGPRGMDCTQ